MATAADIIKAALKKIQIIGSETPIENDEISDALADLNDWGSELEASTLQLGFSPVSVPADDINIPVQCVGMYKSNLAIYLAGEYGAPVTQTLVNSARDSMDRAMIAFSPNIDVEFPDTLPVGVANECVSIANPNKFFPSNKKQNF